MARVAENMKERTIENSTSWRMLPVDWICVYKMRKFGSVNIVRHWWCRLTGWFLISAPRMKQKNKCNRSGQTWARGN